MGGKDNEGREALAAELKEKRGAMLLRDLHSVHSPSPSRDKRLDVPGGGQLVPWLACPCVGRHGFGFGFTALHLRNAPKLLLSVWVSE